MMNEPRIPDEQRLRAIFRALAEQRVEYAVFGSVALACTGWLARLPTWTSSYDRMRTKSSA
jgi:hypothetical protein